MENDIRYPNHYRFGLRTGQNLVVTTNLFNRRLLVMPGGNGRSCAERDHTRFILYNFFLYSIEFFSLWPSKSLKNLLIVCGVRGYRCCVNDAPWHTFRCIWTGIIIKTKIVIDNIRYLPPLLTLPVIPFVVCIVRIRQVRIVRRHTVIRFPNNVLNPVVVLWKHIYWQISR